MNAMNARICPLPCQMPAGAKAVLAFFPFRLLFLLLFLVLVSLGAGCNGRPGTKPFGDGSANVLNPDAADAKPDATTVSTDAPAKDSAGEAGASDAPRDTSASDGASADGPTPADAGPCVGAPDGLACDDGNKCTQRDTCKAGVCVGENPVVCGSTDSCHKAGVCSPDTGLCNSPAQEDGTTCDDGNKCTQADACRAGVCTGTAVVCKASDQCHDAGTCDQTTGLCSNPAKAENATCDDANKCTQGDICKAGVCGGAPVVCQASDQCHTAGTCEAATGTCSNPAKGDGVSCDDGDACTRTDTCQTGQCKGGNLPGCMSSPACKAKGECVQVTDCTGQADGTVCDDGNACTQKDVCSGGQCTGTTPVVCKASDQCHDAGACDMQTGACSNPAKADGATCDDGNACSLGDTCKTGVCAAGTAKSCPASDQCHSAGSCNPTNGSCSNPAKADGASCSDGNACTQTDTCTAGVCGGSNPKTCSASDQCHDPGTCEPASGSCSNPATPNGKSCDDKNACTSGESCQSGVCQGGTTLTCPTMTCQMAGTCVPSTGKCTYTPVANGTGCTDGNACTQTDTCVGGRCTGSNPKTCTASDQCHEAGACDTTSGNCSNPISSNTKSCSDGNACTSGDVCTSGTCTPTGTLACGVTDPCLVGSCDPSKGCVTAPVKDGTSCGGDKCQPTACAAGKCVATTPPTCGSTDPCKVGRCDASKGCVLDNAPDGTTCMGSKACTTGDKCLSGVCQAGGPRGCNTTTDGCCGVNANGAACDAVSDPDCPAVCGNGVVEPGEECDLKASNGCPTACLTTRGCMVNTLTNAGTCQAKCVQSTIDACSGTKSDGCCPSTCDSSTDVDCDRCATAPDISKGGAFTLSFDAGAKQRLPDDTCGKGVDLYYTFTLAQTEWVYLDVLDMAEPTALVPVSLGLYSGGCPNPADPSAPNFCGRAGDGTSKARCGSTFPVIDSGVDGVIGKSLRTRALPAGRYTVVVRLNGATPKPWVLRFDHVPTACAGAEMALGAPGGQGTTTSGTTCQQGNDINAACEPKNGEDVAYFAIKCPFRKLTLSSCVPIAGAVPTPVSLIATLGSLAPGASNPATCALTSSDGLSGCAAPATGTACNFSYATLNLGDARSGLLVVAADTATSAAGLTCGLFGISSTQP